LKIDRSFVSMIDEHAGNDQIVRAIITLARNLGLSVTAEGVETETQLRVLRELHCESAQGYLFARPMEFGELRRFLASDPLAAGLSPSSVDDLATISVLQ
jgi:EAL domain-containing protein (putative c-di-GMP-specific phosphodiesterase class I)